MNFSELKIEIEKRLSIMPEFKGMYENSLLIPMISRKLNEVNITLEQLVSKNVMSEATLSRIINRFNFKIDNLTQFLDGDNILNIWIYYHSIILWMIDTCVESEFYEAAENLKNFYILCFEKEVKGE